jgi:4-amino-4-deoxy-L-arabinose transferase-like glycosyltransferase
MKEFPKSRLFVIGLILFVAVILIIVILPFLMRGAEDLALISFLNWDEGTAVKILRRMIGNRTLSTNGYFHYGSIYFWVSLTGSLLLNSFFENQEAAILLSLRLVNIISLLLTALVVFRIAKRIFSWHVGMAAALAMMVIPNVVFWSTTAHPDLMQLLFLALATDYSSRLAEKFDTKIYFMAIVFAALAFATKYSGLFIMPFIVGAALLSIWADPDKKSISRRNLAIIALVPIVFPIIFFVTNPYVLGSLKDFIGQLNYQRRQVSAGYPGLTSNLAEWWAIWAGRQMLGAYGAVLAVIGTGALLFCGIIQRFKERRQELFLLVWSFAFTAYLIIKVSAHYPRHTYPILPAAAVIVVGGYYRFITIMPRRFRTVSAVVAGVIFAAFLYSTALTTKKSTMVIWQRTMSNPNLEAGKWLENNRDSTAIIYFDPYCYVPSSFARRKRVIGMTREQLRRLTPDVLLVSDQIARKYIDDGRFVKLVGDPNKLMAHRRFYKDVADDEIAGYQLLHRFGATRIFAKSVNDDRVYPAAATAER